MKATADDVLTHLLNGIKGFQDRYYHQDPERMKELSEQGQSPRVLLIACSDSRVDPAILTGAQPGDLFVIRNVANLVPPFELEGHVDGARAAIEYAVRDLKVNHIVVLGHASCGGIKALLGSVSGHKIERDFIGSWVSIALAGCSRYLHNPNGKGLDGQGMNELDVTTLCQHQHLTERAAIRGSLANLTTYPWIEERIKSGDLKLHGWWFDLETGDLWCTDAENTSFLPVLD
ncbi:MAG: carbonic anhydrase [Methylococcus sp.]|jgi:carbonic anhydrase|nr:MAG: carbonic anhydrase [Methylococcus sp.]